MNQRKELRWVGTAYEDLLAFPREARRVAGFQLEKVQAGVEPNDWKSFDVVGFGARELRVRLPDGAWRVIYLAKFESAVYVLHCFQKKTQQTTLRDKQIAQTRYRSVAAKENR